MVITLIRGGLGNQFFQYATGRRLAHINNTVMKLDRTLIDASEAGGYRLGEFNIQEIFATPQELELVADQTDENYDPAKNLLRVDTSNAPMPYVPKIIAGSIDNVHIHGYWQREEYFKDIASILMREFTPKNPLSKVSNSWREKIISADCAVSMHIRRSDYLFPTSLNFNTLPMNYYFRCVNELKKTVPKFTLFVFSNDLDWAKKNLDFGVPTEFVEGCEKDFEELYLMTLCKHNIIANSSFSWWGAWLNPNPDKKVFKPNNYLVTAEGFTSVAADYNNLSCLDFPPLLSVIIYADDDNIDTIVQTLSGIFSQQFQSYEIIILDANICNNSEVYRKFANHPHMTILKVNPVAGKHSAWNKALEFATGTYTLFLTGKDFIFPELIGTIANIWENEFQRHFVRKHHGTTYAQFQSIAPNIICAYQSVEENPEGTVHVSGIDNRNFVINSDSTFNGLTVPTMIYIENNSKLALIASKKLNNLIGTKIFRREFLIENNIRFDENVSANAELLFLVDAFMRTDRIIVVPQVFYGRMN